ncbi:MAG: NAD(P)H-hydrate dehydratase [Atopobiaceae bacterium]|jgi:NAD(P)H-hydrate epimerase|nr:NAD(P)H-hydrate dehydratase [Atopobiaceae bacterium]MCI2174100.1 NAD(P)H-hydrate dehydratase [Atopobiaceae bacterium]MCI2206741.1 NAD(P)H-hydrate dehydratase [Atopobiaceae bacterium]
MQPVLNVEDVKRVERALTHEGVSTSELMHRAGSSAAQEVLHMGDVRSVVILVGFGNNGGDGWVASEVLAKAGLQVTVVSPVEPSALTGDLAPVVAKAAVDAGIPLVVGPPRDQLEDMLLSCDVVMDAMLGTGFHGSPHQPFDIWIECVNQSGARVVSVDVPSGLSAQTGHVAGPCIVADVTITMLALKPGLLADEGRDVCGAIVVAPLAEQTEQLVYDADPVAWRTEVTDYIDVMTPPTCAVDKYSRGSVLVVGGSTRYPGAPVMSALAAARAGAGYVTLAVPEPVADMARAHLLEIPVVGMPADDGTFSPDARASLNEMAERSDCTLVGPGLTVCSSTVAVCSALLETKATLVMDADALNCLARLTSNRLDNFPELIRRTAPLVLTPHARELGRLMGLPDTPPDSLTSSLEAARRIVWADGGSEFVVMAKGTATACVGVEAALLPKPGPASLATAGSGDVLAGITAALLTHTPEDPSDLPLLCALACEIHGYAGSMAADRRGTRGVMATDIIDCVGLAADAIEEHASYSGEPIPDEDVR